jgi:hypothetical protein
MPATRQGNANSGHRSPLRHPSAWSLPRKPSTPPARSAPATRRRIIGDIGSDVMLSA